MSALPWSLLIRQRDGKMTATRKGEHILLDGRGRPRWFQTIWPLIAAVRKDANG